MGEWAMAAAGNLVLAGVLGWMAFAIARDQLPRQGAIGIRTGATLHSDVAWHAGHRAALPLTRLAAWITGLGAFATIAGAAVSDLAAGVAWGSSIVAMLGVVLRSAVVASRAARAADPTH